MITFSLESERTVKAWWQQADTEECTKHALKVRQSAVRDSQQGKPQPGEGTADILEGGLASDEQGAGRERRASRTKEVSTR